MLTREHFIKATELPRVEVKVPLLGGSVFVRALSAGELDAFEVEHRRKKGADVRARMVVACACDEAGNDLFRYEDVPILTKFPAKALDPIVKAALALNGMEDQDALELEKNS